LYAFSAKDKNVEQNAFFVQNSIHSVAATVCGGVCCTFYFYDEIAVF